MIYNSEEREAWTEWATQRRLSGEQQSNSMEAFINGLRFWKKKEKVVSPFVQNFIDLYRGNPDKFAIEYCFKDHNHTHIQLRDVEMGFQELGFIPEKGQFISYKGMDFPWLDMDSSITLMRLAYSIHVGSR